MRSSSSSLEMDAKESQEDLDVEKSMPRLVQEVEGLPEEAIARTITTTTPLMDLDKGLIGWDSVDDLQNPLNWPASKRLTDMILMSVITFLSPLGSSIFAPGIGYALHDLHTSSQAVGSLMITIYLLGYALGPLFLSPLSEIYGRYPVVIGSCWFFVAFLLGCSFAPSMAGLIVMRFLAGTGGSAVMTIAPAMVADLYPLERRGLAMGTILVNDAWLGLHSKFLTFAQIVQSVSPSTGPICGGFIAQRLGWRWAYWILVIAAGTVTLLLTLFMFEPYAPAILERKTRRLRKELGRPDLKSKLALQVTRAELMKKSLIRPLKLLTRSPAVFLFSLYVATIYGMLYLSFTTIPSVFSEVYGFSVELTGLVYIPFGVGMIICLSYFMKTSDKMVMTLREKNNGVFEPEMRLPGVVYIAAFQGMKFSMEVVRTC